MTWNGGGTLTLQLGPSAADGLVLTGALTKGTRQHLHAGSAQRGCDDDAGDLHAGDLLPRRPLSRAISPCWSCR